MGAWNPGSSSTSKGAHWDSPCLGSKSPRQPFSPPPFQANAALGEYSQGIYHRYHSPSAPQLNFLSA